MNHVLGMSGKPRQSYGDLTELNTDRTVLGLGGKDLLAQIAADCIELMGTSSAIYERNGDYALGIQASGWCRLLDERSRQLCGTNDNRKALKCGKWHCHESCWEISKAAIDAALPIDRECLGGIQIYAAPIRADGEIVGAISFGYGDPPSDPGMLEKISKQYDTSIEELAEQARAYESRPSWVIDLAKSRLETAALLVGTVIERKRAEEALRESRRKTRAIFDQTFQFIGLMKPDGTLIDVNKTALESFGLKRSEVIGRLFWETPWWTHSPELQEKMRAGIRKAAAGEFFRIEAYHPTPEGSVRCIDTSLKPVKDEAGNVVYIIPEGRDITDLKQAEEQHHALEEKYRRLVEDVSDIIYATDQDGTVTYLSPVAESVFGRSLEDLVGRHFSEVIHPEDVALVTESFAQAVAGESKPLEHRIIKKSGEVRWLRSHGRVIRKDGQVARLQGVMADVTERKQVEEANRFQAAFVANMSHELRTPLGVIMGYLDILLEGTLGELNPNQIEIGKRASASARDLFELLKTTFELSRMDSPHVTLDLEEVWPKQVLADLAQEAWVFESAARVPLRWNVASGLGPLHTDRRCLSMILKNLIANALKFTETGEVVVNAAPQGSGVEFTVCDTGVGIPAEEQATIFDPFRQGSNRQGEHRGAGLGLYLVRRLTEALGGTVSVESEVGRGSTFHVRVPLRSVVTERQKPDQCTA